MKAMLEMGVLQGIVDIPYFKDVIELTCFDDIGMMADFFYPDERSPLNSHTKKLVFIIYKRISDNAAIFKFHGFKD